MHAWGRWCRPLGRSGPTVAPTPLQRKEMSGHQPSQTCPPAGREGRRLAAAVLPSHHIEHVVVFHVQQQGRVRVLHRLAVEEETEVAPSDLLLLTEGLDELPQAGGRLDFKVQHFALCRLAFQV
eukprot:TRINITY_DN27479_c0_g1_i1.p1 TRINITY_DN27479_c0_g1~~TRINITY_DN27479_c0_g1_i1.p1  ORF type:complete len:124 (-),score=10.44 TRINITY_DN27479_c0_g1_i1:179-550(-)